MHVLPLSCAQHSPALLSVSVHRFAVWAPTARAQSNKLTESSPGELFFRMPCLWLDPVLTKELNPSDCYFCPVYKTSARAGTLSTTGHSTNFIVTLHLPTAASEAHWIRRGVALLSQLDD